MFTPKYPPPDTAPAPSLNPAMPVQVPVVQASAPTPVVPAAPVSHRPAIQLTPGTTLALVGGGTVVVLVVGAVLVSMLLAAAITSVSVAVVAVVLRFLINDLRKGR